MLCAALLAMCAGATEAARPATIELRSRSGTLGSLAQVALEEGGVYVSAERLAAAAAAHLALHSTGIVTGSPAP